MPDHRLVTTHEAAVLLSCHEKTVRRMILRGDLPAIRVGSRWRLDPDQITTVRMPDRHAAG